MEEEEIGKLYKVKESINCSYTYKYLEKYKVKLASSFSHGEICNSASSIYKIKLLNEVDDNVVPKVEVMSYLPDANEVKSYSINRATNVITIEVETSINYYACNRDEVYNNIELKSKKDILNFINDIERANILILKIEY